VRNSASSRSVLCADKRESAERPLKKRQPVSNKANAMKKPSFGTLGQREISAPPIKPVCCNYSTRKLEVRESGFTLIPAETVSF
jgi:hypothetical protein